MSYTKGSHITALFDVNVDGNNRWDTDRIVEVDVYPISLDSEGNHSTDTTEPLASVRVPGEGYSDDTWITVPGGWDDIRKLPENIQRAVTLAVGEALAKHLETKRTQKYSKFDTVFITDHRFPGNVVAHTLNGGYIIDMADSGELGEFGPDELEDYDQERWHA